MTRTQTIELITTKLGDLSDDQLLSLADIASTIGKPTIYSSLSAAEKAEIDAALDELDRGEGVPWDTVKADLDLMISAAGA